MAPESTAGQPQFSNPFVTQSAASTDVTDQDAAAAAPAGAAFGLVFQAADPAQRVPRQAARPAPSREDADEFEDQPKGQSAEENGDESPRDDDDDAPRRRRRGGRGRRGKSGEDELSEGEGRDDAEATDEGQPEQGRNSRKSNAQRGGNSGSSTSSAGRKNKAHVESAEKGDAENDATDSSDHPSDSSEESDGGSRKRTRRRRRSGAAGADNDDPNTVTKVREPRKSKDEVTSIKGSTRLEAKKQRRREGREAGRRRTVVTEAEFLARRESVDRVMVVREQEGRTQIGVLEDGVLAEHYVSRHEQASSMAGNVYLGRVQNVLPSMEAAFVDIGRGRNAVLYAGEVNWDAAGLDNQPKRIEHALKAGESVLVQVTKDPIGHKGARLTSQISLPGRFLVYVPGNSMTGISRKLPDTERSRLKKILKEIVPADAGVIVRTAAEGASEEELRSDVERLTKMWERIQKKAEKGNAPSLLHGEPDLTVRVIRDVFNEDFSKMIVSGEKAWGEVHDYISDVAPDLVERLHKWDEDRDVFAKHRIDEQLAKAMDRKVWLPSGGSLVIDRTEAMTVVDVNTGKFIGSGGNLEETVTKNNIEAAEEIVRQLRLRDIGGIIVVDFIDMVLESNRELVVRRLLECLGRDRTKHQVAEVTSLGLVQMTRKRVGTGLVEVFSEPCNACQGRGIVIHDHPVETRDINGNDTSRRGKGRRGRDASVNAQDGSRADDSSKKDQQNQAKDNGFAQIAAAAHAAAISAGEKPESGQEPAVIEVPAQAMVSQESVTVTAQASAKSQSSTSKRRGSRRAGTSSGAPTSAGAAAVMTVSGNGSTGPTGEASSEEAGAAPASSGTEQAAQPSSPQAQRVPASSRPKRSRRAASSSGTPVALQAVDLSSPTQDGQAQPLTQVAGEVAGGSVTASGSGSESGAQPTPRKRRARVVSPAGSPGQSPTTSLD